jgi:hypothetical protein
LIGVGVKEKKIDSTSEENATRRASLGLREYGHIIGSTVVFSKVFGLIMKFFIDQETPRDVTGGENAFQLQYE